jgi:hypothetical protein
MPQRFRPDPAAFERCVSRLCLKIEAISVRGGVPGADCGDLEGMLAAMPPLIRDRVKLMLEGINIQAEFTEPDMALAARYIQRLAETVWEANPHPPLQMPMRPRSLSRAG